MKALFFCVALLFLASPGAHALDPPRRSLSDQLLNMVSEKLDFEKRALLAEHFPKLFPIHFLCRLERENAQPITVAPGDWINLEGNAILRCPELFEAKFEKQSRFRLSQYGNHPGLLLEQGRLTVNANAQPFFLETPALRLGIVSAGHNLLMSALATDSAQSVGCNRGALASTLDADSSASEKKFLFSHSCRMEVRTTGTDDIAYLHSQDLVEIDNISLSRQDWPNEKVENVFLTEPLNPLSISFLVKQGQQDTGKIKANWMLPPALLNEPTCVVYAQKEVGKPAKEAARFEAKDKMQGEIDLEAGLYGSYLSLVCEDKENTLASTVVFQK